MRANTEDRSRRPSCKGTRGGNADLPTALTGVRIIRFPKVCSQLLSPEKACWRRRNGKDRAERMVVFGSRDRQPARLRYGRRTDAARVGHILRRVCHSLSYAEAVRSKYTPAIPQLKRGQECHRQSSQTRFPVLVSRGRLSVTRSPVKPGENSSNEKVRHKSDVRRNRGRSDQHH